MFGQKMRRENEILLIVNFMCMQLAFTANIYNKCLQCTTVVYISPMQPSEICRLTDIESTVYSI